MLSFFGFFSVTIFFLLGRKYLASAYPEEGKWNHVLNEATSGISIPKTLYAGSQLFIQIHCTADPGDSKVVINWYVAELECWNDPILFEDIDKFQQNSPKTAQQEVHANCSGNIMLERIEISEGKGPPELDSKTLPGVKGQPADLDASSKHKREVESVMKSTNLKQGTDRALFTFPKDGYYTLILMIRGSKFTAEVQVEMLGKYGYLSAADWPLLPFYGAMCLVYAIFGLAWLIVSFCQWRDLLRIQFWIGAVILLGMLEKATFYAEYQTINSTGVSVKPVVLLAEWVSCGKRTLARMLVIIVSLGFGIVKPRLGSMLHRLVGTGAIYFILAVVESYIRVMHPENDPSNQLFIASIPLALLDSIICWWIFTALIQTTRTLRLRRNLVKLNLYRHFTNTLIFAVLASVVFMLYSIKAYRLAICVTDWKELWVNEAYWHILFSVILLVIMILWRPTNNNQRYAFTPLLDAADDDEEEDQFVSDAYGVKMRTHSRANSPKPKPSTDSDILKWVDENIPSAGMETVLTTMDSEEEIVTAKFEVSKMQ
ncbi:UNVERIFIED_CONTAM: hypothetical protein PYX00_009627 [Menopon gallinae]|uniref:Transmembrane protein 87A n=1 Tax=Menopon gallinae TaxID=328185 RepID=A0AAW2HC73_9NEOP